MKSPVSDKVVNLIQYVMYALVCIFGVGIIGWVVHLLRTSWELQDVPSASIGISIVAIPLFLALVSIFSFVFWGLMRIKE